MSQTEDFLKSVKTKNYRSDYFLLVEDTDDYIKEIRYESENVRTFITELQEFIKDNPGHAVIEEVKQYREI